MQIDARGKNRVIAYASRKLNAAGSNYSVTHQETLAVVWALRHFRDIIFGYPVQVCTDHAAITELFMGRNLTGRLARGFLTIQKYCYDGRVYRVLLLLRRRQETRRCAWGEEKTRRKSGGLLGSWIQVRVLSQL